MTIKANGFRIIIVCMDCTSTNVEIIYEEVNIPFVHCNKCGQESELL
jgi:uncharacterized Zn finger protein